VLAATDRNAARRTRPTPRTATAAAQSERRRRALRELETETLNRFRSLGADHASEPRPDQPQGKRDLESVLEDQAFETLRRIDEARARLEAGTYGLCQTCAYPISQARLRALPFAVFCRSCQARQEQEAQSPPPEPEGARAAARVRS